MKKDQESETELGVLEAQLKEAKDHMRSIELLAESHDLRSKIDQLEQDLRVKQKAIAALAPTPQEAPPTAPTAPAPKGIDDDLFARMRTRFGAGWADGRGGNGGR